MISVFDIFSIKENLSYTSLFQFSGFCLVWALYGLSVITLLVWLATLKQEFSGVGKNLPQAFTLVSFGEQKRKLQSAVRPFYFLLAFCWPLVMLLVVYKIVRLVSKSPELITDAVSGEEIAHHLILQGRNSSGSAQGVLISPVFAGILMVLYLAFEFLRLPLLVWLLSIWIGWLYWLLAMRTGVSVGVERIAKAVPKRAWENATILMVLFSICIPFATSFIILAIADRPINLNLLYVGAIKIYTLQGIVWTGASSTIEAIRADPIESLYVATGVMLYTSVLSKVPQLFSQVTEEDQIFSAVVALMHGKANDALQHLRTSGIDSDHSTYLKVVALLMNEKIDDAHELARAKLPGLHEHFVFDGVSASGVLVAACWNWDLEEHVVEKIMDHFCSCDPLEVDLFMTLLPSFSTTQSASSSIIEKKVLEVADEKNYEVIKFFHSIDKKDIERLQASMKNLSNRCSINPGLHALFLVAWMQMRITVERNESEISEFLTNLELLPKLIYYGSDTFCFALALNWAKAVADDAESLARLKEMKEALLSKVSLRSYGPEFVKAIENMPPIKITPV